jgi:hypothetical protein
MTGVEEKALSADQLTGSGGGEVAPQIEAFGQRAN